MYELFYKTGACSRAVHALMNELALEFTLHPYEDRQRLLAVNPRGQVPTLIVDGEALTEGAAIITFLCDTHPSAWLPASGLARGRALQWLAFANSSLHPLYSSFFHGGEAFAKSEFGQKNTKSLQALWDLVEAQLEKTAYLAGETPTVGDILTTVIAQWTPHIKVPITLGEKTQALVKTITARPAFAKAVEAERAAHKTAA